MAHRKKITKEEYEYAKRIIQLYEEQNSQKALFLNDEFADFIERFNQETAINGRKRKFTTIDRKAETQFYKLIRAGISIDDIFEAIQKIMNDQWHKQTNWKYVTPEFVTRSSNYERFSNQQELNNDSDYDTEYQRHIKKW